MGMSERYIKIEKQNRYGKQRYCKIFIGQTQVSVGFNQYRGRVPKLISNRSHIFSRKPYLRRLFQMLKTKYYSLELKVKTARYHGREFSIR